MSENDREWQDLSAAWRQSGPRLASPSDVKRHVRARQRRLWAVVASEALVVVLMACVAVAALIRYPDTFTWLWTLSLLLLIAAALAAATWNRRGLWKPDSETVSAYLEVSVLRCQRRLRSIRIGWWVFAADVLLIVAFYWKTAGADARTWVTVAAVLAATAVGLAVWSVMYRASIRRELHTLQEMKADMLRGRE